MRCRSRGLSEGQRCLTDDMCADGHRCMEISDGFRSCKLVDDLKPVASACVADAECHSGYCYLIDSDRARIVGLQVGQRPGVCLAHPGSITAPSDFVTPERAS